MGLLKPPTHGGYVRVNSDLHRMEREELRHNHIGKKSGEAECENAGVRALDLSPGFGDFGMVA